LGRRNSFRLRVLLLNIMQHIYHHLGNVLKCLPDDLMENIMVGFDVFTAVTIRNAAFWDVSPRGFTINRRFEGTFGIHLQGRRNSASEGKC
jgi:hypothetical protein